MKKLIAFLILVCILFCCGCAPSDSTESNNGSSVAKYVQPLPFENIDLAIEFLENPDLSEYQQREEAGLLIQKPFTTYKHMIGKFTDDGYVTVVKSTSSEVDFSDRVGLYPEVKPEDSGVSYYASYKGLKVQFLIYNYSSEIEFKDHIEYNQKRFGRDWEKFIDDEIETIHGDKKAYIRKDDDRISVYQPLDSEHYMVFKAWRENSYRKDKKIIIELLDTIRFEKIELNLDK